MSGGGVPAPGPGLHPLLRRRWSPRTFDPTSAVTQEQLALLLEAARWAPSAGNSQPWSFIAGRRGDDSYVRIARHLATSSAAWAACAGLLVVNLCHRFVEDTEWDYSEFSTHDLGQAVAHMTFQALSLGLAAHQFRAFDKEGVTREFAVPPHWEVSTMTAFGVAPDREPDARDRREMRDLLWPTRERPEAQRLNLEELVAYRRECSGNSNSCNGTALRVTPTRLEAGDSQGIVDGN